MPTSGVPANVASRSIDEATAAKSRGSLAKIGIRKAQSRNLRGGIAACPHYQQIRFQRNDAFEIERGRAANRCDRFCCWRIVAVLADADHGSAGTGSEQQFGCMRRRTDDAARWLRKRDGMAAVVNDADRLYAKRRCQQ